jgi:hypothetical protein
VALDTADDRALAGEVARRSITLLTNDGTLPVDAASAGRVAVLGPNASDVMALFGNYSFENHLVSTHFRDAAGVVDAATVLDAIERRLGVERVVHERGCEVMGDDRSAIAAAVAAAREADLALVVVGDRAGHFKLGTVGEGTDTADLSLPGRQDELVEAVIATGTPTVVVLLNGRPFALGAIAARAAAIVEAWFPGQAGADAVVDVLFGDAEPGGRSTVTFSRRAGAQPVFYNHKPLATGFPEQDDYGAVFPFGHGLTYTTFEYGQLELSGETVPIAGEITVACTVTNVGRRPGDEVVQLYVRDPVASVTRPVLELKGFVRVSIEPAEQRRIEFTMSCDLLSFTGPDLRRIVEPGTIEVKVGSSSADIHLEGTIDVVGDARVVGHDREMVSRVRVV